MKTLIRLLASLLDRRRMRSSSEGQFLNSSRSHNGVYV